MTKVKMNKSNQTMTDPVLKIRSFILF